jgi:predicted AlkP superfamily phosphohydrolase/phosphomutase
VLSEKIADYKVKKNNHLGLKEGMVIKDCLYTVVESSDSITSNHDQFTIKNRWFAEKAMV